MAVASGLPAWLPLYLKASTREGYLSEIGGLSADYRPRTRVVYSCLGYILLAAVLERAGGATLDRLADREIFSPLGLKDTGFRPPPALRERIAATENPGDCPRVPRKARLRASASARVRCRSSCRAASRAPARASGSRWAARDAA